MKLITALQSELFKTKRTASFYFTLIGAAPVPLIFLLNTLTGGSDLKGVLKDPLNLIYELGAERAGIVFFPLFVVLICTLLPQIEYRNNTWKQVMAAPQTKANVFLARFINIQLLILLFLIASLAYMTLVIVFIHFYVPSVDLLSQPLDGARVLARTVNTYVSMMAVSAFQFWLGLRFRNFLVPIALGFTLWLTGLMMVFEFKSPITHLFPYSFQNFVFLQNLQPKMPQVALASVGYTLLFLLLGFLDFRRRRMMA